MKTIIFNAFFVTFLTAICAFAQKEDRMCGSVEKFNQTKRWQDLPGCAIEDPNSSDLQPGYHLDRLKSRYKEFYDRLETSMDNRSHWVSIEDRVKQLLPPEKGGEYGDRWASDPTLIAAKPLYKLAISGAAQRLKWRDISENDEARLDTQVGVINREMADPEGPSSLGIKVALDHIVPLIDKLKAVGAPDDLVIAIDSDQEKYTIGEMRILIPKLRGLIADLEAKNQSAYTAKWQPFLTVLKGDRLELFIKYEVGTLQGAGGRMLRTPEDFKTSPFYAKYTNGTSGVLNRWNMTIWRFRGDKIIAIQSKSGWGDDPPSAAFR